MSKEAYYDRVEAYTSRAAALYPGEVVFNKIQLAKISGKSPQTLYNNRDRYYFRTAKITIKEFVRMEMS